MVERTARPALLLWYLLALPTVADAGDGGSDADDNWGQWRGPLATGVAPRADPPIEWSEDENVRWKLATPGVGHSTPIVWGDRIFLTAAVPVGDALPPLPETAPGAHDNSPVTHREAFVVLAIGRSEGEVLWQRTLREAVPHESAHVTGSYASNSPATDGELVYAFFGSRGLYALDMDGAVVWALDLGEMQTKHAHGEGSSPVLYGDTLVVNWDHEGDSFVVALDKRTGKERWRRERDEVTSWATPIVVEHDGKRQLIVSGSQRVRAYDLATGETLWECGGLSRNVVASPVAGGGMVFAGSSYDRQALLAIRIAGARGDISRAEQVVWTRRRGTPYVPSPLLYEDTLYFLHHYQAILSRVEAATGDEPEKPLRLAGIRDVYASPVAASGRVYVVGRNGTTIVLRHGDSKILARNHLEDTFDASPALIGQDLILRGERFLYCIAAE